MPKPSSQQTANSLALASSVGCMVPLVSLTIIGAAGGIGYLIDQVLGTNNVFLMLGILGSLPVSMFALARVSLYMVRRSQLPETETTSDDTPSNSLDNEQRE